jgi:hypothetical protein
MSRARNGFVNPHLTTASINPEAGRLNSFDFPKPPKTGALFFLGCAFVTHPRPDRGSTADSPAPDALAPARHTATGRIVSRVARTRAKRPAPARCPRAGPGTRAARRSSVPAARRHHRRTCARPRGRRLGSPPRAGATRADPTRALTGDRATPPECLVRTISPCARAPRRSCPTISVGPEGSGLPYISSSRYPARAASSSGIHASKSVRMMKMPPAHSPS